MTTSIAGTDDSGTSSTPQTYSLPPEVAAALRVPVRRDLSPEQVKQAQAELERLWGEGWGAVVA